MGARRRPALPGLRRADRPPDAAADRRPPARAARGHPVPGAGPGGPRPQGRVRRPVRRAAGQGLRPGPRRRRGGLADDPAHAGEEAQAHHRRRHRPARGQAVGAAPPHRLGRDRARAVRRPAHDRDGRPRREGPRTRAAVQREARLPERPPPAARRGRAPHVLVQRPLRRLRDLHRHRRAARGRPRAARARRRAVARRGRDRAVGHGAGQQRVLPPADEGPRRPARLLDGQAVAGAARARQGGAAARRGLPGARAVPEPVRPRAVVHLRVRGRRAVHQAAPLRDRLRLVARAVRGLHARGAVPRVQGRPAQARGPRRAHRRPLDRPGLRAARRRVRAVPRRARAGLPPGPDRGRRAQGDQRPARLPARRRPRLPLPRPPRRHAVRRRGAAHPAGDPDRVGPGRGAVRARRAEHRPAPARQPPADLDADEAARPRQHPDRGRARRGHHRLGRLGRRHRSRRGGARRPRRALRLGRGAAEAQDVADGPVPVGSRVHPGAREAARGRPRPRRGGRRRPRAQPARASTSRSRSAASWRSPGCPGRASRRW